MKTSRRTFLMTSVGVASTLALGSRVALADAPKVDENNAHIPADAVRQRFAGRKDSELYVYPQADHGFNCGDRASFNAKASALAYGHTLTFLGEHL